MTLKTLNNIVCVGGEYKNDIKRVCDVFESLILDTPGWLHIYISECEAIKMVKRYGKLFKYFTKMKTSNILGKGVAILSNTFYCGETRNYKFRNYVEQKLSVYKMVLEYKYTNDRRIYNVTTFQHLKQCIRHKPYYVGMNNRYNCG